MKIARELDMLEFCQQSGSDAWMSHEAFADAWHLQ
jgi:hypothetical protein